jgi:hypothetical protein
MSRQRLVRLVAEIPEKWLPEVQRLAHEFDINPAGPRWVGTLLVRLLSERATARAPRSRRKVSPDRRRMKRTWGNETVTATPEAPPSEPIPGINEAVDPGLQFKDAGPLIAGGPRYRAGKSIQPFALRRTSIPRVRRYGST